MSEATHGIEELKLEEPLFKHVKFYISGKIRDEQEIFFNILQDNGGKRMNYFSDFVTHCILGEDASESDILYAKEVPAVTQDWVILSEKCKKLLPGPYDTDSESSSSEDLAPRQQPTTFTFSDEEEETKRVVRSAKEKRYEDLMNLIKQVRNHKKIKNMS